MKGYALALDFPISDRLFGFLDELDEIVLEHGGRLYLTKDVRMNKQMFMQSYPNVERFIENVKGLNHGNKFRSFQSDRGGDYFMKTVLILGATSDMAKALAHKYASQGFQPILAARQVERLQESATDIEIRYKVEVNLVEFDALAYEQHASFYQSLPAQPDVAICVFGYLGEQQKSQADFSEVRQVIDSNYTGAVSILEIIAGDFERRKTGTIIGISSVAGDRGRQSNYIYGSAKAALSTYLSGLRNRLSKVNVHVLTVKTRLCSDQNDGQLGPSLDRSPPPRPRWLRISLRPSNVGAMSCIPYGCGAISCGLFVISRKQSLNG